jgi:transcription elongation GreA/GreB family factor
MNKTAVRAQILHRLQAELSLQASAAQLSRDEAISEESRAENKWDTHSQEAAYLAEGQSRLVAEIGASIQAYSALALPTFGPAAAIDIGALAEVEQAGTRHWYFIGPRSGGIEIEVDGQSVLVLTPQSPLGRELLGKRSGDTVRPGGRAPSAGYRIVSVS